MNKIVENSTFQFIKFQFMNIYEVMRKNAYEEVYTEQQSIANVTNPRSHYWLKICLCQKLGHSEALESQHKRCNPNWKHFASFRVTEKVGRVILMQCQRKNSWKIIEGTHIFIQCYGLQGKWYMMQSSFSLIVQSWQCCQFCVIS